MKGNTKLNSKYFEGCQDLLNLYVCVVNHQHPVHCFSQTNNIFFNKAGGIVITEGCGQRFVYCRHTTFPYNNSLDWD
jgi:hypothetical protein